MGKLGVGCGVLGLTWWDRCVQTGGCGSGCGCSVRFTAFCRLLPPNSHHHQVPTDVADPFYGVLNSAAEAVALRRALHAIVLGCRGLMAYLLQLRSR